jgi:hypothetical protein
MAKLLLVRSPELRIAAGTGKTVTFGAAFDRFDVKRYEAHTDEFCARLASYPIVLHFILPTEKD